jgi:hypothetical protein
MRSSACDTLTRLCVRRVLCWLAFPLASALRSTGSAAVETALFVGFPATMAESDFSRPCIIGIARPKRVAFRTRNGVGTRGLAFAAQWLAYALPYRRFVAVLADANARLGADVDRYSFIVVDFHHLLLAGLPAHFESHMPSHAVGLFERCNVEFGTWKAGTLKSDAARSNPIHGEPPALDWH